jgi:hypothetical protein
MKHGYTCGCGWRLNRGSLTRRWYAATKEMHALACRLAANELRQSRHLPSLDKDAEPPYQVGVQQ